MVKTGTWTANPILGSMSPHGNGQVLVIVIQTYYITYLKF